MTRFDRILRVALLVSAATFLVAEVVTMTTTPALEVLPFWSNLGIAFYAGNLAAIICTALYLIDDARQRRSSGIARTFQRHEQVKRSAA